MHFTGIIITVITFLIIGIFHPIVIKTEYYFGTKPWWVFLVLGIICMIASVVVVNVILSTILGILGATLLWTIKELFEQEERVAKGWYPKNEKRTSKNTNK
jgi:membrane protein